MPDVFTVFLNTDDDDDDNDDDDNDDDDDDDNEIRRPPPSPPPSHRVSSPTLPFCFSLAAKRPVFCEVPKFRVRCISGHNCFN